MRTVIYLCVLVSLAAVPSFSQHQWVLQEYLHRTGKNANEYLGGSVTGIGDFNEDGIPAVAVSDYGNTGIWYITANTDTVPKRIFVGTNLAKGDINGDGYSDVVVAKIQQGGVGLDTVFIYYGSPAGVDSVPDVALVGENINDAFGSSIVIGDLNGDGIDDLVIAAQYYPHFSARGKIYIYFGRHEFSKVPDYTITGDTSDAGLGVICKMGDVNGDGISDLVVTGLDQSAGQGSEAYDYVNVYFGRSSFDTLVDFRLNGLRGKSNFAGLEVMDANGDGIKDILWGYNDSTLGSTVINRTVRIYYGKTHLDTIPDIILPHPSFTAEFGATISDAGDMDGDGYHDIAVGDPSAFQGGGFVFIYRGGPALDTTWDAGVGQALGGYFGGSIDTAGDVNGDGLSDIIVGAPQYAFGTNQGYFGIFLGDRHIATAVKEKKQLPVPRIALLEQNFPNPFNPKTDLRFEVRNSCFVTLKIFDVLGREMATLLSERKPPGSYSVSWDGNTVQSGIYFYRLTVYTMGAEFYSETKKLLLIK